MEKIREKLIELRREKGLSQADLSRQTGISTSAISFWETGEKLPGIQSLLKLSRFYGISLETLVDDNIELPD